VITKYYAEEGDTVEVGAQFLEVDTDAKAPEGGATPAPAAPEPTPAASTPAPPKPTEAPKAATPAPPTSAAPQKAAGSGTSQ